MNTKSDSFSYRFPIWITVIFFLLFLIPFSIFYNFFLLAKVSGILCLIVVLFALRFWFRIARKNAPLFERVSLTNNDWFEVERLHSYVHSWKSSEKLILRDRIGLLLANVEFKKVGDELCDRMDAILLSFHLVCFYWEEEDFNKLFDCVIIQESNEQLWVKDKNNLELKCSLRLNPKGSFPSVSELKKSLRFSK